MEIAEVGYTHAVYDYKPPPLVIGAISRLPPNPAHFHSPIQSDESKGLVMNGSKVPWILSTQQWTVVPLEFSRIDTRWACSISVGLKPEHVPQSRKVERGSRVFLVSIACSVIATMRQGKTPRTPALPA